MFCLVYQARIGNRIQGSYFSFVKNNLFFSFPLRKGFFLTAHSISVISQVVKLLPRKRLMFCYIAFLRTFVEFRELKYQSENFQNIFGNKNRTTQIKTVQKIRLTIWKF